MDKITVIGAGNVGATCANVIAHKDLAREVGVGAQRALKVLERVRVADEAREGDDALVQHAALELGLALLLQEGLDAAQRLEVGLKDGVVEDVRPVTAPFFAP